MSKISVSKAVKAGVGKYETVDIQASIELEVTGTQVSFLDAAYKRAFEIVDAQINSQLNDVQGILKPDSVFLVESKPKTSKGR